MSSSIVPARAALFDRLTRADEFNDVQVTYGPPGDHEAQKVVALLGILDGRDEPEQLGNLMMEETYGLELGIKVHDPSSTDPGAVEAEAFALVDVIRAELRSDITLDGTLRTALPASVTSNGPQEAAGGGWVVFVSMVIDCTARISLRLGE